MNEKVEIGLKNIWKMIIKFWKIIYWSLKNIANKTCRKKEERKKETKIERKKGI